MLSRGANSIAGLGRVFKAMDSFDGNKKVDKNEFVVGLKEYGLNLSKDETEALLKILDKDNDGKLNFDEFLEGIRGKPNA